MLDGSLRSYRRDLSLLDLRAAVAAGNWHDATRALVTSRARNAHAAPARAGGHRWCAAHRGACLAPPRGERVDGRRWHPRVARSGRTASSLVCLRRAHRHDQREERVVSFELARRQFFRRHPDEEGDGREHIPSPADDNVVWSEHTAEQP